MQCPGACWAGQAGQSKLGGPGPWLVESLLLWARLQILCFAQLDTGTHVALPVKGL